VIAAQPLSPARGGAFSGCSAGVNHAAVMTERPLTVRAVSAVSVLALLFVTLGVIAHRAVTGTMGDHAVFGWMVHHRSPTITWWAIAVTNIGSPVGVGVLTLVLSAVLWRRLGSPWPAVVVVGAVTVAAAISTTTKVIVGAHRPPLGLQLILETDAAFPSGHVTGTVALLGALIAVIGRGARLTTRAALLALAVAGAVAVAFTRLYLGVHWVSDVIGGLVLGTLAAVLAHLVYGYVVGSTGADTHAGASSVSEPIRTAAAPD